MTAEGKPPSGMPKISHVTTAHYRKKLDSKQEDQGSSRGDASKKDQVTEKTTKAGSNAE